MSKGILELAKAKVKKDENTAVITIPTDRSFFRKIINEHGDAIASEYACTKFRIFISDEVVDKDFKPTEFDYEIVDTIDGVQSLVERFITADAPYSLDFETTSLNTFEAEIVGVGLSGKPGTFYIPLKSLEGVIIPLVSAMYELRRLFTSDLLMIVHNAGYELKLLRRHGIYRSWKQYYDTQLPVHMDNPAYRKGLKKTVKRLFHVQMEEYEDLTGKGKKQITFDKVAVKDAARYCAADAYYTMKIYKHYENYFGKAQSDLLEWDRRLSEVVIDMEEEGILLDVEHFNNLRRRVETRMRRLESLIYSLAGEEFNLKSTKQLGHILYEKLKVAEVAVSDKGNFKTGKAVLEELPDSRIVRHLLEFRKYQKIYSTYLGLTDKIQKETGRLHASFNQNGTETGRFSSANPNLQNIPVRTSIGKEIRKGFIAKPGYALVGADYSQVELRVFACKAKDEPMIKAFKDGEDIHRQIASQMLGIPQEDVTSEQRSVGKTLNFAILYMQGAFSTAKALNISVEEAQDFIDKYYNAIPGLNPLIENTHTFVREHGFITTMLGRRRYFPDINSRNWKKRKAAEREAFNAPIQGSAADILKKAMVVLNDRLRADSKYDKVNIILTVHDELVCECPEELKDEIKDLMVYTMENVVDIGVKLLVDAKIAYNYGDLK